MPTAQSAQLNADPRELAKFADLAHRWWDKASEFKPLHDINPLRLDWIEARSGGLKGLRVLDVGCGGGLLSEGLAARGAKVTGIDLGEAALGVARLHLFESGLEVDYRQIAVEDLAQQAAGSFDLVTCLEMLEHVPQPASVVHACARLAKAGGQVCFSTLNRNPKSYLFAVIGAEYLLRLLPRGTHDYARFIRPAELAQMCRTAHLTVQEITGMSYRLLTQSYYLCADTRVNYLLSAIKAA